MELNEIKEKLEEIDGSIFEISLKKSSPVEELSCMYRELLHLKSEFLKNCFTGASLKELESIRYGLEESFLNVTISIREKRGLSIGLEVKKMERLVNLQ